MKTRPSQNNGNLRSFEYPWFAMVPWSQMVCVKLAQKLNVERWTCDPKPAGLWERWKLSLVYSSFLVFSQFPGTEFEKAVSWWFRFSPVVHEANRKKEWRNKTANPTSSAQWLLPEVLKLKVRKAWRLELVSPMALSCGPRIEAEIHISS